MPLVENAAYSLIYTEESRFISNFVPPPPTPTPTHGYPNARFDEERDPKPQVPICTPMPRYSLVAGPEPTPSPTPVPNLTLEQFAQGACIVSDGIDPFQANPAFAGGPGGLKDIIDQIVLTLEITPPSGMPFVEAGRFAIQAFDKLRKTVSTAVSIACQQLQHEGLYYDVLPLDEKLEDAEDSWSEMSPRRRESRSELLWGSLSL